jgi:hypothetical protein
MTYQGDMLYQLQQIDLSFLQQQKRLQEIRHLLEKNVAVQTAQAALNAAQADLKPRQAQVRDLELQSQAAKEKRDATEGRLYSGEVKNPRELQDMQNEIESLKRRLVDLDEKLLETMADVEEKQATFATAQQTYDTVSRQVEDEHRDLVQERVMIEARLVRLQSDRATLVDSIAPENLRLYDTLKPQKANRPISLFTEDTCSVCGIEQTALVSKEIRRREALVKCRNCGRILVYMPK